MKRGFHTLPTTRPAFSFDSRSKECFSFVYKILIIYQIMLQSSSAMSKLTGTHSFSSLMLHSRHIEKKKQRRNTDELRKIERQIKIQNETCDYQQHAFQLHANMNEV